MTLQIRKILCPTDFSPLSEEGLHYGIELAQKLGAQIRVIHAYGLPTYFALPEAAVIPSADYAAARSVALQDLLDSTLASHEAAGVQMDSVLRLGVVHDEIVGEAERWNADMIVVSSHGHTGLAHVILGSVAERVVRLAHCPVLVVRKKPA